MLAGAFSMGLELPASAQVAAQRLLDSAKEPPNWLM